VDLVIFPDFTKLGHRSLFPGFRIGLPRTVVRFSVEMSASLHKLHVDRHGSSPLASCAQVSGHATQNEAGSQRRRSGGGEMLCFASCRRRREMNDAFVGFHQIGTIPLSRCCTQKEIPG
jgi:hypothetical protein